MSWSTGKARGIVMDLSFERRELEIRDANIQNENGEQ